MNSMTARTRRPRREPRSANVEDNFGMVAPALHGMPHMQPAQQNGDMAGSPPVHPLRAHFHTAEEAGAQQMRDPRLLENDDAGLPVWARLTEPSQTPLARSMYMQQIQNLFQSVLHNTRSNRPTRLTLTSVQGGEGEMRIAADLARAVVANRMRAVLVDADLRNPEFSHEFGLGGHMGLGECLEGRTVLGQSIVSNVEPGMDFVPAGGSRVPPEMLMTAQRLNAVMNALAQDYNIIIVKIPPPGTYPETAQIAALSDIVLLAALSGRTSRAQVENALWQLTSSQPAPHNPGLIITGVREPDFLGTGPTVMRGAHWQPMNRGGDFRAA